MTYKKEKKFLNLPRFHGGKEALSKFIGENIRYPAEAIEAGVEGKVLVSFDIDDNGKVHNVAVINGIGHGCDEEAMRIVGLLQYQKVKNRGRRVLVHSKINIRFKLPVGKLNYTIKPSEKKLPETIEKAKPITYNYTITLE
ncbi:MAG: energy transducer TonB [Bacteroidales bacterium]|jgi:TonB family protein|nr:energy transducer TonB [Bacteroidales bacterium]